MVWVCVCILEARGKVNSGLTLVCSALSHLNTHTDTHAHTHAGSCLRLSSSPPKGTCPCLPSHLPPKNRTNTPSVFTHTHILPALSIAVCDVNKVKVVKGGGLQHAWIMTHSSAPLATATAGLRLPGVHTQSAKVTLASSQTLPLDTEAHIFSLYPLSHILILIHFTSHMCSHGRDYWISLLTTLFRSQTLTCFLPHPLPHLLLSCTAPSLAPVTLPALVLLFLTLHLLAQTLTVSKYK